MEVVVAISTCIAYHAVGMAATELSAPVGCKGEEADVCVCVCVWPVEL